MRRGLTSPRGRRERQRRRLPRRLTRPHDPLAAVATLDVDDDGAPELVTASVGGAAARLLRLPSPGDEDVAAPASSLEPRPSLAPPGDGLAVQHSFAEPSPLLGWTTPETLATASGGVSFDGGAAVFDGTGYVAVDGLEGTTGAAT